MLIDDQGAARLADFGCSTIMDCPEELSTESAFSVRFTAPEVFSSSVHTNQSDIYGFALTALHVRFIHDGYRMISGCSLQNLL